jgi:hypothetical protein
MIDAETVKETEGKGKRETQGKTKNKDGETYNSQVSGLLRTEPPPPTITEFVRY